MSKRIADPRATADFYRKKLEATEQELAALREGFGQLKAEHLNLIDAVMAYETEVSSAKRLIWAMVKAAGGEIRVPDIVMQSIDNRCQIGSRHDPEESVTVIEAKTVDPTPPEKRNGGGGGEGQPS
jgi:hypothetical protein